MVCGVRLHARKRSPAHVVECLHQVRIAREGLWRADVFHTVTLPQPVRPAESRQAGFGGNSGPGKNHDVANVVHRRHQAAENKWGKAMTRIGLIGRSEEHTSELQSLMRISYAVFCLKKKKKNEYKRRIDS